MKYAKVTGVVGWSGGTMPLNEGVTTADDDHELVHERPDLWTDKPPMPHLEGPARRAEREAIRDGVERPVERATARPGERRETRRG